MTSQNPSSLSVLLVNLGLVLVGALIFALGFPNFIADWGWAPCAWISLIPIVLLIRRIRWWTAPLWGALYGYITYTVFNFWLSTFNPVSFVLVPLIYAGWFFMLFPLLKLAERAFGRSSWLVQWIMWAGFEVIRTKGFIGYSYGILGYSQYGWSTLISIADIFGVMGVSLLVTFPSFLLGGWLLEWGVLSSGKGWTITTGWKKPSRFLCVSGGLWAAVLLLANVYGILSRVDYTDAPRWRPALIQHNINTWLTGTDAWRIALNDLMEESEKALALQPDAVIWSETAFVPSIRWHTKYRLKRSRVDLINTLSRFLDMQNIPFIIGNNDAVMEAGKRVDYNAALLMDGSTVADIYRKIHLVPFSEYFPYSSIFPRLMDYIQSQGTPLYKKGTQSKIFDLSPWNGPNVSTLICFEDTFGYLARNAVRNGASVLVNISNDSWSSQAACAIQHQNIAIFRSVENRRSMVRATAAGLTCVIDPNGKVLQKIEPFTQAHLIADVPVYTGRTTLYTRWGNWFEHLILALAIFASVSGLFLLLGKK